MSAQDFDLDALTDRYAPSEDCHIVSVPGFVFAFRAVRDHSVLALSRRKAADWANKRVLPEAGKDVAPTDSETAASIFILADSQVEVPESVTVLDSQVKVPVLGLVGWSKIAKKAGLLFDSIWRQFDAATIYGADVAEAEGIDEAKKDSNPTEDSGTD